MGGNGKCRLWAPKTTLVRGHRGHKSPGSLLKCRLRHGWRKSLRLCISNQHAVILAWEAQAHAAVTCTYRTPSGNLSDEREHTYSIHLPRLAGRTTWEIAGGNTEIIKHSSPEVSCGCADLSGSCCQSLWNRGDLGPEALTNRPHRGGRESQQEPSEASGTSRTLPLLTALNGASCRLRCQPQKDAG